MRNFYLLLVVVLFIVLTPSCKNKKVNTKECADTTSISAPCKPEGCCKMDEAIMAELEAIKAQFANWANLADNEKVEIIAKAKAFIDKRDSMLIEKGKNPLENLTDELKEKWNNFTNLTPDEQKELIEKHLQCCHKDKEGQCKDKESQCKNKESQCKNK